MKGFEQKICPFCSSNHTKKNGKRNGKQRYKCLSCQRQFDGGLRLNPQQLWEAYSQGKQTLSQLAWQHQCSIRTIHRHLYSVVFHTSPCIPQEAVSLIIDTTYFGHSFGALVVFDDTHKQVLSVDIVQRESSAAYHHAVHKLIEKGLIVQSITCDGWRGLDRIFSPIPIQLCQFHQIQTITKYLTRRPQSEAAQALRVLALALPSLTHQAYSEALENWYRTYKGYLNERSRDPETGKTWYTHKRLRSAYRSLKTNRQRLFTFEVNPSQNIPKTSNALEAHFAALKTYLRCHQGLKIEHKIQFIKDYLYKKRG